MGAGGRDAFEGGEFFGDELGDLAQGMALDKNQQIVAPDMRNREVTSSNLAMRLAGSGKEPLRTTGAGLIETLMRTLSPSFPESAVFKEGRKALDGP